MAKTPQKKVEEEEKPVVTAGSETEGEPEVVVAQAEPDNAAEELKQQIEALRRSEQAARQELAQAQQQREQALRYAQQREVELSRSQKETSDSRLEAIQNGIAAAEAEITEAKHAFRMAAVEQDIDAQVAAQERLAEAQANKVNLTNGKMMLEQSIKDAQARAQLQAQQRQQQAQQAARQGDQLDRTNLPQTAKNWLRAHPEYLTDQRKNAKIQSLHWDVLDEGHAPFSDAYYASLEQHLGLRSKQRQNVAEEDDDDGERRAVVSAPVSREAPSAGGERRPTNPREVRLSAAEKEAAKLAGVTEVQYAENKLKMLKEKANGNYGGQP